MQILEIITWIGLAIYMYIVLSNIYNIYVKGKFPNFKSMFIGDIIGAVGSFLIVVVNIYKQDYVGIIFGIIICAYISYKAYKGYIRLYK